MEKTQQTQTEETNAALKAAHSEPPFLSGELAKEIEPLLNDYFEAEITRKDGKIYMTFLNGQRFVLAISEE